MSFIASYYTVVGCYDSFGTSIAHWGRDIMPQVEKLKAENSSLNEESRELTQEKNDLR